VRHSLLSSPAIWNRAKKEKLLSDEFFSTFLNDAAFVKTFLISGRRASKRRKRRGEKGLSRNRWSFYFNGCNNPLPPDLIKNTTVRILLHLGIEEIERERKRDGCTGREESVLKSRGSPGAIVAVSYITFCSFFSHPRRGDYHPQDASLSIAFLDAPRRRRRLDEIFIETPVDYSDATRARANSRDCEFIWWCNRRRGITLAEPRAEIFSNIKVFAPKMKFGRRGRADANEISRREMSSFILKK
jgi:hypothetical protein